MADAEEVKPTASPQPPPDDVKAKLVEEKEAEDEIKDTVVADDALALDGANDLPDAPSASAPEATTTEAATTEAATTTEAVTTEAVTTEAIAQPEELEARIPAKKDATLREFLSKMDDYAPIVSYLQAVTFA